MEKQKCPQVRFNNFSDEWKKQKLFDVAFYKNGKSHESEIVEKGQYIVVNSKFVSTNASVKKYCRNQIEPLHNGDIAFVLSDVPNGRALSKTFLIDKDDLYTLNQRIAAISPKENCDSAFLHRRLNRHEYFLKFDDGVGQTNLSLSDMEEFISFYPSKAEQKEIGIFFQNLDQSIALHEKKLIQTQNFKKAMLEKMFPKQGSKRPEIRLKGFSGDWHNSKLSDYISIKHGYAFNGEFFSDKETDYCLLTPGNFMIGGGFKAEKFIYYKGEVPKNYILKENDLIVTMTDLSKESDTLGLPALLPSSVGKTLLHNQRLGLITFENLELEKEFLFYLLQTKSYHKYIVLSATGTTVKHTSPSKILGFTCKIPEPTEQKKIGGFFKKINEKINLHQQQLQTLKNLKQAFLEKMFV